MGCIFCPSQENLTDEHIFPAFMGGELEVKNASCQGCNGDFGRAEARLKVAVLPLLNLLKIGNRYEVVPNAPLSVEIQGVDLKNLPAFMDGKGTINLKDVVKESITEDGRRLRQGFFLTQAGADKFVERGLATGNKVIERKVPDKIVIEAEYTLTLPFAHSIDIRRVVAKIALTAIAHEYGVPYAQSPQFDSLRQARTATSGKDLRVWSFTNEGLMGAHTRTAHQHSVMCYLSGGMRKGWALVTLFGGLSYLVEVTTDYVEPTSRQFSIFYDAVLRKRIHPIVLANEMTLIGHVLSPASKFEDRDSLDEQWFPIISAFCAQKSMSVTRIEPTDSILPQDGPNGDD